MEIRADGHWYHEGGRIDRPAMVRLFSTILRREPDGGHVLVTPAEKLAIAVEDTPFRAVEMKSEGAGRARRLIFRLDTDDLVLRSEEHTSELQSLMRISYAVFCLKTKLKIHIHTESTQH